LRRRLLLLTAAPTAAVTALRESLHLELLRHQQKTVQLILRHVHLTVIHKTQHRFQILVADVLQIEQGVLVGVLLEHAPEEGGAGGQYDLVRLYPGLAIKKPPKKPKKSTLKNPLKCFFLGFL
jgi:hypothetical protein